MNFNYWLPSLIASGALALAYFLFRRMIIDSNKNIEEYKTEMEKKIAKIQDEYLTMDRHELLCENNHLKLKQIFNTELEQFKNEVFKYLRNMEKSIAKIVRQNGRPISPGD